MLQQVEDFGDATVSANDCFCPVSRLFDRITRPEQIIDVLSRAMAVLTDPAACGPVTLCLCQDVQAEAYDYPGAFFEPRVWRQRRIQSDADELAALVAAWLVSLPRVNYGGTSLEVRKSRISGFR